MKRLNFNKNNFNFNIYKNNLKQELDVQVILILSPRFFLFDT